MRTQNGVVKISVFGGGHSQYQCIAHQLCPRIGSCVDRLNPPPQIVWIDAQSLVNLTARKFRHMGTPRDPARIPAVLEILRLAWERNPEWQLLVNAIVPNAPCPEFIYIEDDQLVAHLQPEGPKSL